MPCYSPLKGYKKPGGGITFHRKTSTGAFMQVPCGQCIGCRLKSSVEWAIRCMHEAHLHNENTFLTLTYAKEPEHGTLRVDHFQEFMKRLRSSLSPKKIRFFHCGEYAAPQEKHEKIGRPHYHALIFGHDFPDKRFHNVNKKTNDIYYTSKELTRLWGHGHAIIGDLTFESAAYVARYCTKKITGDQAESHYMKYDENKAELLPVKPEYTTMSTNPGLGRGFLEKYPNDIYPHDHVIVKGRELKPPRYYDEWLKEKDPEQYECVKELRELNAKCRESDNTDERLIVKEIVKYAQITSLKRPMEMT